MKSIRQLLRQPLKSLLGVVLMGLAIAALVVCLGQYLAAQSTGEVLENTFSSVALPMGILNIDGMEVSSDVTFPEDIAQWAAETAKDHPDVITQIAEHGILSAQIQDLTPLNYSSGPFIPENITDGNWIFYRYQPDPYGMPYSTAMLLVTLEEISEPEELLESAVIEPVTRDDFDHVMDYIDYMEKAEKLTATRGYTLKLTGTVQGVVSLQEGFRDPTGMIIRMTITLPTLEELDALKLEAGGTYLVFGTDYVDTDWALRTYFASEKHHDPFYLESFDMDKMRILSEEEQNMYLQSNPYDPVYALYGGYLSLSKEKYEAAGAVRLTLKSPISTICYDRIWDESGKLTELRPNDDIVSHIIDLMAYTFDLHEIGTSREEYIERYTIPTIARVDGTVEEFLASGEGEPWREALDMMKINNQAFAVLGVEKVGYLADFARENSRIVEGREFTVEEQKSGARVCVIHETLAAANGLTVGDTITLNLYETDENLPYQSHGTGLLTPAASFWFHTTPFAETAEYTIVGLWRGEELWGDVAHNTYTLSPNTVIVPKASVQTPMEHRESVLFSTIVLKNGAVEEFRSLAARGGYGDRFICHDQGYSSIAGNFHNYDALGKQVLLVGASIYAMVLILFLLFFPGAQRKNLWTMESLGAGKCDRFGFVMIHAGLLLLCATFLGGAVGLASWGRVLDKLQTTAESAVRLSLEPGVLLLILLAQLAVATVLSALVALFLSRTRGMRR